MRELPLPWSFLDFSSIALAFRLPILPYSARIYRDLSKKRSGTTELFIYLPIRRDGLSLFDDGDIAWDDLAGFNF